MAHDKLSALDRLTAFFRVNPSSGIEDAARSLSMSWQTVARCERSARALLMGERLRNPPPPPRSAFKALEAQSLLEKARELRTHAAELESQAVTLGER
jgi:hypothetical protein